MVKHKGKRQAFTDVLIGYLDGSDSGVIEILHSVMSPFMEKFLEVLGDDNHQVVRIRDIRIEPKVNDEFFYVLKIGKNKYYIHVYQCGFRRLYIMDRKSLVAIVNRYIQSTNEYSRKKYGMSAILRTFYLDKSEHKDCSDVSDSFMKFCRR